MRAILLALALFTGCAAGEPHGEAGAVRRLRIVHFNDLHAQLLPDGDQGGFAYVAAAVDEQCGAADCLVLDGGDLVQGTPVSTLFHGVPIYEIANGLGIDASTLGNHEFDYGWETIAKFREKADFPLLNANLTHPGGLAIADAPYAVIKSDHGVRVAVIGLLTETLPVLVAPKHRDGWVAAPVRETVEELLPELRGKADVVVALGHLDSDEEQELLAVPGIDFVVSGHAHAGLRRPIADEDSAVVRVVARGHQIGVLDLAVDVERDRVVDWSWKVVPVRPAEIEPDAEVAREVEAWEARVSELVDVELAVCARDLDRDEMKLLFERALREETGADVAYHNPGGVRALFSAGTLFGRDVWNAMPFDNRIVTGTLHGRELPRFLVQQHGLDPDGTYKLATIDFVAANWKTKKLADLDLEEGELFRDLLIRWIRKQGRIGD